MTDIHNWYTLSIEMPGSARVARGDCPDVIGLGGRIPSESLAGYYAIAGRIRPEYALDIISEGNAVKTLSSYVKAGSKLIITANARNSDLITKILQRHEGQYNIVNLFKLASTVLSDMDELDGLAMASYLLED